MQSIKYIDFPKSEYADYQVRLNNNKIIYTTRVSNEVNQYMFGNTYDSPFGNLKVVFLKHFQNLKEHPFIHELTQEQILEINQYIDQNGYDVIGLEKQ